MSQLPLNQNDPVNENATNTPVDALKLTVRAVEPRNIIESQVNFQSGQDNLIEKILVVLAIFLIVLLFPFSILTVFLVVKQFERVVILRNGKLRSQKTFGPGLVFYLPCIDTVKYLDLRIVCYAVRPQEVLTKDALTISVDAVVYYKIDDPVWAVIKVADYKQSTQYLAATTLRNAIGTRKLTEVLLNRRALSNQVFEHVRNVTHSWGVKVVRVEIKDIRLPIQLQKAMAAEAESSRLANAKIIVAQAEIECNKSLQKATNLLMENPWGMQLRYLQSLQIISGEGTHTVVIPFMINALRKVIK